MVERKQHYQNFRLLTIKSAESKSQEIFSYNHILHSVTLFLLEFLITLSSMTRFISPNIVTVDTLTLILE